MRQLSPTGNGRIRRLRHGPAQPQALLDKSAGVPAFHEVVDYLMAGGSVHGAHQIQRQLPTQPVLEQKQAPQEIQGVTCEFHVHVRCWTTGRPNPASTLILPPAAA